MNKIVGIGNALVDLLIKMEDDELLDHLDFPKGSMQLIDLDKYKEINSLIANKSTHLATGGSAGNTILALACLGEAPGFIGKIGSDSYGQFYRSNLQKKNIKDHLIATDFLSGVASTFISPDGERTFGTYLGASSTLSTTDISSSLFAGFEYLYVEGYLVQDQELLLHIARLAKNQSLKICIDLASYNIVEENIAFFKEFLREFVDVVFANEEEARALTGRAPKEALAYLASFCDTVVIKLGAKGAVAQYGDQICIGSATSVDHVVDTTGAGDFFAAGFLYGLIQERSLECCLELGALLSGSVIQVVGTDLEDEKWNEIKLKVGEIGG